jgi:hypothetical protein
MRRDLEQRAQEAILASIIEDSKKKKEAWLNDPPLKKAIFLQSFFSTKNAMLIAAMIVATGFVSLFLLVGSVLGFVAGTLGGLLLMALAEVVFMYSSLKDEKLHARVVAEMLRPQIDFNPADIKDNELREKVDKALEYWSLIDDEMKKIPGGIIGQDSSYAVTHQEATNWLQAVYNLAKHVDKLRLNKVVQQDLKKLPGSIKAYEAELKMANAPEVQDQLEKTIADKKRQLHTLQTLENNVAKATYQLDSTISSLGTIYSQLLLVGSKDQSGGRMNRLQAEISEQVRELEDLTEAMDEVYQSSR